MNCENIMLHERVSHEKQHIVRFHLYEVSERSKLTERKQKVGGCQGPGRRGKSGKKGGVTA